MKNRFLFISSNTIAIFALFICISCQQSTPAEQTVILPPQNTTTNDLPHMALTTLEGNNMMVKNHQGKAVLVLFQPECDDCQREAVQIRNNIEAFKDYTLFFISSAPLPQISEFRNNFFQLNSYDNVIFAQTTVQNVINTLGPIPAPSVYIYADGGKLVKYFNGEIEIEVIKNVL
ncbi:hypothetical protein BH23BAC1_BH23BAC1_49160 [soil metagenome]